MFGKLFKKRREDVIASDIYTKVLQHSRNPKYFGEGRVEDSYDGRIGLIGLNMSLIIWALKEHGEKGEELSQSLTDILVQDFEIALREEGLGDTGVKRRIKPMVSLFMTRVMNYAKALEDGQPLSEVISKKLLLEDKVSGFAKTLGKASEKDAKRFAKLSWDEWQAGNITFSEI